MFKQFQNIDKAFKHIKLLSIVVTVCAFVFSGYAVFKSNQTLRASQGKAYVIVGGELREAISADRSQYIDIEIQDHVQNFHTAFYSLEPDENLIKQNIVKALYLSDESAKAEYDNLMEAGYYSDIVSGNISQRVLPPDSIQVNTTAEPYTFRYFGKLKIVRATTIVTRNLITEGIIRVSQISKNNPHGFLIERWKVIANNDLSIEKR